VLWLGSNGNGLFRQDPQVRRFARRGADGRLSVWQGTSLRALCETDAPAALWLGAANGKLYRMNRRSGEMSLAPPPRGFPNWGIVVTMLQDKTGALWIGNFHGLFRVEWRNGRAGAFSYFKPEPNLEGTPAQAVYDIFEDRAGEIWIATPAYLMRLDRATKNFVRYRYASEDPVTIDQNAFACIHQDRRGRFWLGTAEGLLHFDPRSSSEANGVFQRYSHEPANPSSLSHNVVRAICEDPDDPENILWIGTAGGGLSRFDMRSESFSHFTTKDGLPNMVIYAILNDNDGNLWMSTNHGLSRFHPRTRVFKNFDAGDGLQDNEFNAGSYFKSASGELFFGGINGFNAFYPEDIRDNPHAPPVVFTDFQLFNQPASFTDKNSPLAAPINETKELTLAYDQNVFSFEFAALDYTDPAKNRYRYRMENFDKAWRENGTSRTTTYTNLSPGKYVFRVQGSNNDGVWNEEGASIKIIITPPWWQTWWAYTLYVLVFTAILYGLRRYEMNRQQLKHQVEVERLQAERKNWEAARLQALDQLKSRFFANISHEFRTPLTLILGPVEQEMAAAADERSRRNLQLVKTNAQRLLRLINQLLDLSKLESGKMQLRAAAGDLVAFLQNLVVSFAPLAERKRIALRLESTEKKLLVYFDRDKMEKIFSNLLSNALKFTPEGGSVEVEVAVGSSNGSSQWRATATATATATVTVSDTGIGIPPDRLPFIFDRFYQVDTSSTRQYEGTGIGLALAKELVELHRGTISVASVEGQGTTFTVQLPLGKDHLAPEEVLEISEQYSVAQASSPADMRSALHPFAENDQLSVDNDQLAMTSGQPPATSDEPIILIVEDHAEMRRFVRNELASAYRVLEAGDGEAGWEQALETIPDLVISDVMMPKMNGYELCRRLKTDERTSHIPVILLTAKADQPDKLAGLETGADDYLSKPFDRQELAARVKNLIALRRKLRERFARQLTLKPSEVAVESRDEAFLKKVMTVIEEHMGDEKFEVDMFCRSVNMSRAQLQRKLKALVNQSPMELVRSMRLERAADLLRQNAGSIAEIAYQVGFSNQAHFTRSFHEHFGLPPSEYKKGK
jgi:signal transduction histidine kinase/DNA-binding response OmpR family regulator/streptogramin lyase